jgi:hypothetical protein
MVVAVVLLRDVQAFLIIHEGLLMISVFAENEGNITVELGAGLVVFAEGSLRFLEALE